MELVAELDMKRYWGVGLINFDLLAHSQVIAELERGLESEAWKVSTRTQA